MSRIKWRLGAHRNRFQKTRRAFSAAAPHQLEGPQTSRILAGRRSKERRRKWQSASSDIRRLTARFSRALLLRGIASHLCVWGECRTTTSKSRFACLWLSPLIKIAAGGSSGEARCELHSLRGATVVALVIGQPQQDIAPHQIWRIVRGEQVYVSEVQNRLRRWIEAHDIVGDVFAAQQ